MIIIGGYLIYRTANKTQASVRYVTTTVKKSTLIDTVSGSGQVSVSNQADIKAKASGDVIYVGVTSGQEVKAGALLVQLNASDALKTVRDAEASLESAKIALEKLQQPTDPLSLLQAENALTQAQETKQNAEDDLQKAYDDGFSSVTNAFLNLPTIMTGLNDLLYGNTYTKSQSNIDWYTDQGISRSFDNYDKVMRYRNDVNNSYTAARQYYDANLNDYKSASRASNTSTLEALILETYQTTKLIADAIKNANNFLDLIQDILTQNRGSLPASLSTHQGSLDTYTSQTNSILLNLLSIKQTIDDSKNNIISANRTIAEKTASLTKLKAGADPLDIQSQQLSLKQRQNALADAREKLADYSLRAPFDGIVAAVNVKKGEQLSASTAAITLITKQSIANISLNEVDIAKIKVGQKVTLTFDAVSDITIAGQVAQIDTIGTATQGVVSYGVQINFSTQDDRVKPGMSMRAEIIVNTKQGVLTIPTQAIKTSGNQSYAEVLDPAQINPASTGSAQVSSKISPRQQPVVTGLANDTETEIVSGLNEGDLVITQTINSTAGTAASSQSSSGIRIPGITGGGAFRGRD